MDGFPVVKRRLIPPRCLTPVFVLDEAKVIHDALTA